MQARAAPTRLGHGRSVARVADPFAGRVVCATASGRAKCLERRTRSDDRISGLGARSVFLMTVGVIRSAVGRWGGRRQHARTDSYDADGHMEKQCDFKAQNPVIFGRRRELVPMPGARCPVSSGVGRMPGPPGTPRGSDPGSEPRSAARPPRPARGPGARGGGRNRRRGRRREGPPGSSSRPAR
jgi:hypothetical protein